MEKNKKPRLEALALTLCDLSWITTALRFFVWLYLKRAMGTDEILALSSQV